MEDNITFFVINLPQSVDRKLHMQEQCGKYDLEPIFIDAVYGKNLSQDEVNEYCDQEKAKASFGRKLMLGEVGCALSHMKVYQRIIDDNIECAVILEDDAVIGDNFITCIDSIINYEGIWDVVLLGHYKGIIQYKEVLSIDSLWFRKKIGKGFRLGRIVKGGLGTHGYMISRKGAKKILGYLKNNKITQPIDKITSDSNIVDIYGLFPTVVMVDINFESDIDNSDFRANDRKGEFVYEVAKVIQKTPFFTLFQKIWFFVLKVKPIRLYK